MLRKRTGDTIIKDTWIKNRTSLMVAGAFIAVTNYWLTLFYHQSNIRLHVGAINCPANPPLWPTAKTSVARSVPPFFVALDITKSYVTAPVEKLIVATPVPSLSTE
jgi:hypothetical protein